MTIRRINASDLDGFYSLFSDVNAEGRFSARSTPPPKEAIARALAKVEEHDWPVYVLEDSGTIIGSAEAYPESFCRSGGDALIGILGMQIRKEHRRHGHGAALLSAVMAHCVRDGFHSIELSVLKSNLAARKLYGKAGFIWVEDLQICKLPSGRIDQSQRMRLEL
jgi:ribosomal protein S18 acetylase RimI-like enzyme